MVEDSNQKYVQEFMDYVLQNDDVWVRSGGRGPPCAWLRVWMQMRGWAWRAAAVGSAAAEGCDSSLAKIAAAQPLPPIELGGAALGPHVQTKQPLPSRTQFVTMHQLIDWMRNPIPKSEVRAGRHHN